MKPVTINITNLVGTITIVGEKENASAQIQENVTDALLNVLKSATELTTDSTKTTAIPIAITIESDLLLRIPPRKLSQIVEATLNQIQKEVAKSWWNDAETSKISEELKSRSKFSCSSDIHLQSFSSPTAVLNDEIEQ